MYIWGINQFECTTCNTLCVHVEPYQVVKKMLGLPDYFCSEVCYFRREKGRRIFK